MALPKDIIKVSETAWSLPRSYKPGMRVPALIFATEKLITEMDEGVFDQISNVAMLPGIVKHALCMPDGHWGYGFPIGGVAAIDCERGVISPGGIGFDINCGMRLISTNLTMDELLPHLPRLVDALFRMIPSGVGSSSAMGIHEDEFRQILIEGAAWCIKRGYGWDEDLRRTEEYGCVKGARVETVSAKAMERGYKQIGTLGSGNHYLEIQVAYPHNVFDPGTARTFGISKPGQVVIMFHCGSRGLGHQVATDYLELFLENMEKKYHIVLPDRELACAPFFSTEGQNYFAAMNCAVNMAFANRQMIAHRIREAFSDILGKDPKELGMHQVYDITHNTAKVEEHIVDDQNRRLLVHRKGATRAYGPGHPELPDEYRSIGQPVIIGGSMETGSYLLVGLKEGQKAFYSTAHGSGRLMSRTQASHQFQGKNIVKQMREKGIYIKTASLSGLAQEAGGAYKDIDEVILATEEAGLSRRVVRFVPVGNIKG